MSQQEEATGIPTRAIHESYISMQGSLQQFREAKDRGRGNAVQQAHGRLQQDVLTFYELLRPHLKHESAVEDWWEGKLPNYRHGETPDPEEGKGILHVQTARRQVDMGELDAEALDDLPDDMSKWGLREWHSAAGLNGSVRVVGVAGLGDTVLLTVQQYQMGLRQMDDWETKYQRETTRKSGFMADKKDESVTRQRIPSDRLTRAARELSDVADKLGALSNFNASSKRTRITDEQIDRLEEWRQENLG